MQTPLLLSGFGLRPPHISDFLQKKPNVAWVEVHSENYFAEGGKSLQQLESVRRDYPVSLHGVSLSLGSADDLNWKHLQKLKQLIQRIDPCLVSDHLAWVSIDGQYIHDLLPLPYTEEALTHIVQRIDQTQAYLQRQILIENISSYIQYDQNDYTEWAFLAEITKRSGCGLLLDINNVYVNATNFKFDANTYLNAIPASYVQQFHLGGFSMAEIDGKQVLIDTHSHAVVPAVWSLFKEAVQKIGAKPTIIEWDKELPSLETLYLEAFRADNLMRENRHVPSSAAS